MSPVINFYVEIVWRSLRMHACYTVEDPVRIFDEKSFLL